MSPSAQATAVPVAYALKFISGKYQGGEFPLKTGRQVVIGRSSDLDMVLVEDMVSRKHARISLDSDEIKIEDLGSTNGTFVNGEKVKEARLKEGDRILIGTSILKLVVQGPSAVELDEKVVKAKLEEAAARSARAVTKTSSMQGKIEEVPLPDLLQLFNTSRKNGVLVVKGDQEGKIYLRQGKVYYAVIDGKHERGPQKSFNRIVTWEKGDFELQPPDAQEFLVELDSSTEGLLMDALRQLDELRRIGPELPPLKARLSVPRPLTVPLRDLKPETLDMFQTVLNHPTLQDTMDNSDADDVTVAAAVLELLKKQYLLANG